MNWFVHLYRYHPHLHKFTKVFQSLKISMLHSSLLFQTVSTLPVSTLRTTEGLDNNKTSWNSNKYVRFIIEKRILLSRDRISWV